MRHAQDIESAPNDELGRAIAATELLFETDLSGLAPAQQKDILLAQIRGRSGRNLKAAAAAFTVVVAAGVAIVFVKNVEPPVRQDTSGSCSAVISGSGGNITVYNQCLAVMKSHGEDLMRRRGEALKALPEGSIVLQAPTAMKVGDKRKVEARVGLDVPSGTLKLRSNSQDQTFEASLPLSADMVAVLSGSGFTIEAITHQQQSVAAGFPTVWEWNVQAKEDGEQELEATLYALLPDGNSTVRQRIGSYAQKIIVTVRAQTWGEWLETFGHEIETANTALVTLAGAATAALGWFGIFFHRRRHKRDAKPPQSARGA
jgi:hypothetical protein